MHTAPHRHAPFGAIALVLLGCGPKDVDDSDAAMQYATAVCEANEECACAMRHASTTECIDETEERVQKDLDHGMKVQDECFDALLASLTDGSCNPMVIGTPEDPDRGYCFSLRGDKGAGELCSPNQMVWPMRREECGSGLQCSNGICSAPNVEDAFATEEGEPCDGSDPHSCKNFVPWMYCTSENVCAVRAQLGEACEDFGCDGADVYCAGAHGNGRGVCSVQVAVGDPCDPLDYDACLLPEDPDRESWCDAAQSVCVVAEGRNSLCRQMNWPYLWR
jgi:hypothetical protein